MGKNVKADPAKKKSSAAPSATGAVAKPAGKKAEFLLAASILKRLPKVEQATASAELWKKSSGTCALCGLPLNPEAKQSIEADHYIPSGADEIANLYLAHKTCNASRQDLPFEIAKPLIRFRSIAEAKGADFDRVLDLEVPSARQLVGFEQLSPESAKISFDHQEFVVPLMIDPATGVKYFFVEVPVEFIHNDKEIQPRLIMPSHVRRLALDFRERPVHEPSNCRLVQVGDKTARLLQFDGQHKTTAQILIGRKKVPVKVYIEPAIDMLQRLVIKIQQEIKKQPLTRSDTLAKIGDVINRMLSVYTEKGGKPRTEKGLIAAQPTKEQQKEAKRLYFEELKRIIFFDPDNRLSDSVKPGTGTKPTTDKVVVNDIIGPLVWSQPLEIDMDAMGGRDEERENILLILNTIATRMLPEGWEKHELQRRRATNFFYQGSIAWWMNDILIPSVRYALVKLGDKKPALLDAVDEETKGKIISIVEHLCSWTIWSTEDADDLKAMRSNTKKSVEEAFAAYDDKRLLKESGVI